MYGSASENPSTDSCVLDEDQRLLAAARGGYERTLVNAMEAVGRINYHISLIQTQGRSLSCVQQGFHLHRHQGYLRVVHPTTRQVGNLQEG